MQVATALSAPAVVVVNTNPDLVELLKVRLETAGFAVMIMHVADIRAGLDVGAVLAQHDPSVIVYDVVMPYDRNWQFFQHLRETIFAGRRFVITTPNADGVSRLAGRDDKIYEIVDDRDDIDAIVQAVREAARARPTR